LVEEGSICISLNNESRPYFSPGKGLRQSDPLSSLLFNLVDDVFTRMLMKASRKKYISGFMSSICPEGVLSLQYADDTLLFLKNNYVDAIHLKWIMVCFEKISGMKINYGKSDMVPVSLDEEEIQQYAGIFYCMIGSFPFKYLGVQMHHEKLRREDIQPIVDKVLNRIPMWNGRLFSYGARMVLLKACLASISNYLMSLMKFPKWAIEAINSHMANLF
jgi:hypothetical protein